MRTAVGRAPFPALLAEDAALLGRADPSVAWARLLSDAGDRARGAFVIGTLGRLWRFAPRRESVVTIAALSVAFASALHAAPIHDAARDGDLDEVARQLDRGVSVDEGTGSEGIGGRTPLHLAVEGGHLAVVELLLDRGANPNVRLSGNGFTPLWEAAGRGRVEIARALIEHGADVNASDWLQSRSPLHMAAGNSRLEAVELLIRHGADVNALNVGGETPLMSALTGAIPKMDGNSPTAERLIEAGADVSIRSTTGNTALHTAVAWGFVRVTKLLIEKGADVEARDDNGFTPLHEAASLGNLETAKMLIDAGAEIHARSELGLTPLHRAAQAGDPGLVSLLLDLGADVNAELPDGRTPVSFALQSGHPDVARLLRQRGGTGSRTCMRAADIEAMNRGGLRRMFSLEGLDARIFLALDPRLLMYPDAVDLLMEQEVDEIVAWRISPIGLAAAVPFARGCAVEGYGEPDLIEKIERMKDVVRLIDDRGIDDGRVRRQIRSLANLERSAEGSENQTDSIIAKVRALMAK